MLSYKMSHFLKNKTNLLKGFVLVTISHNRCLCDCPVAVSMRRGGWTEIRGKRAGRSVGDSRVSLAKDMRDRCLGSGSKCAKCGTCLVSLIFSIENVKNATSKNGVFSEKNVKKKLQTPF